MNVHHLHAITPQLAMIWLTDIIVPVWLDIQGATANLVRKIPIDHVKIKKMYYKILNDYVLWNVPSINIQQCNKYFKDKNVMKKS